MPEPENENSDDPVVQAAPSWDSFLERFGRIFGPIAQKHGIALNVLLMAYCINRVANDTAKIVDALPPDKEKEPWEA